MTLIETLIDILKNNPEQRFTARDLAQKVIAGNPRIAQRRDNYASEAIFIGQIVSEIGSLCPNLKKRCPQISTQDKPRPRVYFWQGDKPSATSNPENQSAHEQELYPKLIDFLTQEYGLYSRRINEHTSANARGKGGNHWLHPDIVAMEALDAAWNDSVRDCVRNGGGSAVRLWSFEVKKHLTTANVRKYFFQTVSNSSWANFAYLVATGLDNEVEKELHMLCGLHGIGVLLLNTESLFDSQILIPAQLRSDVDWLSVNRLVTENRDFKHYIEQVGIYLQTGKLVADVWNK